MNDFIAFRKFVTPAFIQAIFWVAVILIVIGSLFTMFSQSLVSGLIGLILGPLAARIYCEIIILLFRIYDELVAIRTGTIGGASSRGFPVVTQSPRTPGSM